MYFNKSFKERMTENKKHKSVNYNDAAEVITTEEVMINGINTKQLVTKKVSPCDNFRNFTVNDFRLENLIAAGVEIKEMTLGNDPDFANKLEELANQIGDAKEILNSKEEQKEEKKEDEPIKE